MFGTMAAREVLPYGAILVWDPSPSVDRMVLGALVLVGLVFLAHRVRDRSSRGAHRAGRTTNPASDLGRAA